MWLTKVLPLALQLQGFIAAQASGPPNLIDGRSEAASDTCKQLVVDPGLPKSCLSG